MAGHLRIVQLCRRRLEQRDLLVVREPTPLVHEGLDRRLDLRRGVHVGEPLDAGALPNVGGDERHGGAGRLPRVGRGGPVRASFGA